MPPVCAAEHEGAVKGRLANLLGALDGAIAATDTNIGEV
jgi:hypothetical protein